MKLSSSNKFLSFFVSCLLLSLYLADGLDAAEYWVSPSGSDKNPGTFSKPFQTLKKARDAARPRLRSAERTVIWLKKGEYKISETLNLTKEDSGTARNPVIWQAVANERVILFGGERVAKSAFKPVKDQHVLSRIISVEARAKLVVLDLQQLEDLDCGQHSLHGFTRGLPNKAKKIIPAELSVGGKRMTVARWPNPEENFAQWLPPFQKERIGVVGRPLKAVIDPGPNAGVLNTENPPSLDYFDRGGSFSYEFNRPELWIEADDIWLDGVLSYSWAWIYNKVAKIDTEKKIISLRYGDPYGIVDTYSQNFFFFENLLEEIDVPGEYYIDRKKACLYFYPTPAFLEPDVDIVISQLKDPFINLSKVSHISFKNFIIESSRGPGLVAVDCKSVDLEQLEMRNIGGTALDLTGSDFNIARCHIHSVGEDAINLSSGKAEVLEAGKSTIEDCHIHQWGYYNRVYQCAVRLSSESCGNRIVRNRIHDSSHCAIILAGNDNLIEYNRLHDLVLEFTDMGAIYGNTGENPLSRNNTIRNNFFHDMGRVPYAHGMPAVYPDWGTMGWNVEQNVFARIGQGKGKMHHSESLLVNSSPHILIKNNIFIDCALPLRYSNYTGKTGYKVLSSAWTKNFPSNAKLRYPKHFAKYPELETFYKEPRQFPTSSRYEQNLIVNQPEFSILAKPGKGKYIAGALDECETLTINNNAIFTEDPGFQNMADGDFSLRKDSLVFSQIKGFKAPEFEKMLRHSRTGPFLSDENVWVPKDYKNSPNLNAGTEK